MLITVLVAGISAVSAASNGNLARRDSTTSFFDKYRLGDEIEGQGTAFKCTEINTKTQYICKFKDTMQLPTEISILTAIHNSPDQRKELFIEMKEYSLIDHDYATLPQELRDSRILQHNYPEATPYNVKFYVEVLHYYDDFVDGFDYLKIRNSHPETNSMIIFKQLVLGIQFLYELGYSHSDIKSNFKSTNS